MGHTGNTIDGTGGVRFLADIRTVLGVSGKKARDLCTASSINPWAKCKPFVYPAWKFASTSARLTARQSRNCGLVMKDYGSLWDLWYYMIAAGAGAGGWKHDKPDGGPSSPFRPLDFLDYDGDAGAPLQVGIYPNPAYKGDSPRLSDEGGAGSADIQLSDLQGGGQAALMGGGYKYHDISGLYIGVAYGTLQQSPDHAYTLGPVSSFSPQYIPAPGSSADYYVVPFLSNKTFTGSAPSTSGVFIPCPIGMSRWNYYNYYPFLDRGTYQQPGQVSVSLRVEALRSIPYTSLGVQFSNDRGATWSTTVDIYTTQGSIAEGTIISTNKVPPVPNPTHYRMVVSTSPDTRSFPISGSPSE